jgi:hypothetical protein
MWKHNKSAFKIMYFFMVSAEEDYYKIPKDLAMLLYNRLFELKK